MVKQYQAKMKSCIFMLLFTILLTSCEPLIYNVPKSVWLHMTTQQQMQAVALYNQQHGIPRQGKNLYYYRNTIYSPNSPPPPPPPQMPNYGLFENLMQ